MENILAMTEGWITFEITSFDQIDHNVFQEFLAKCSLWDFYKISTEKYMNKGESEEKSLILKSYNHIVKGKLDYLFHFYCLDFVCQMLS